MKQLPEDELPKPRVSLTERIARVGVWILLLAWGVGFFIYGVVRCEAMYEKYNAIVVEGEREWKE